MDGLNFVEPQALATLLRDPEQRSKTAIIDVRDEEFEAGHIVGAVNAPSESFAQDAAVDAVIDDKLNGAEKVVVHCMLSQQRGPRCALKLLQRLEERGKAGQFDVVVLKGGWQQFSAEFKSEEDLVDTVRE